MEGPDRSIMSADAQSSVVSTPAFQVAVELLQRAVTDSKYLERRLPKIYKLKEVLSEHFARHENAGSSTRALIFTGLRSTVHEIKTEISELPGKFLHFIAFHCIVLHCFALLCVAMNLFFEMIFSCC
jgi:ERCC4-related helicase